MSANDIRKLLETIEQMEQAPAQPAAAKPGPTDPSQMDVRGAKGSLNPQRIAQGFGWPAQNVSQFAAAVNKLKNAEGGASMRDLISTRQAWTMADALWKLMTSDPAQKRRLMNMLMSFREQ